LDIMKNQFKRTIAEKRKQLGIWCNLGSPLVAEILAGAGFEWMVIDAEHGPNELTDVLAQHQAVAPYDVEPLVRIPWNDMVIIKRYADAGIRSFLIPFVQNKEEAQAAVSYTRYPPMGVRGVSIANRSNRFGQIKDYHANAHKNMCVVVQIETEEAVNNLSGILSVDGIDAVFIGPSDLAASMGHLGNNGHPEVQEMIARARELAMSAGKPIGTLATVEEDARRYFSEGFTFIAVSSDMGLVSGGSNSVREKYRDIQD
jgi:2-keto-3-deoxy-L-rhamnonate aldolase RhmA